MKFKMINNNNSIIFTKETEEGHKICTCGISIDTKSRSWDIKAWYTVKDFQHAGHGKDTLRETLAYCLSTYGIPDAVYYTWNGMNEYVLEWIEQHFDAICICPIAVQKNQADDDWDSHIYKLDRDKLLKYFMFR